MAEEDDEQKSSSTAAEQRPHNAPINAMARLGRARDFSPLSRHTESARQTNPTNPNPNQTHFFHLLTYSLACLLALALCSLARSNANATRCCLACCGTVERIGTRCCSVALGCVGGLERRA